MGILPEMNERTPGVLHLLCGTPNPAGALGAQVYLLAGDASAAPLSQIVPSGAAALPPRRTDLPQNPFHLTILHFNDLHGHISRITQWAQNQDLVNSSQPIFSHVVWLARQLRKNSRDDPNTGVLFLSGGDDLGGAAFDELLGDGLGPCAVHPGYQLYSAAGVDAGVIGNHDLDKGTALLARAIKTDAAFPLLSANLAGPALQGSVFPAALLVIKGIRVGLVGLTTAGEVKHLKGDDFQIADPVKTANNLLPALAPLCDVLIILSHLGNSLAASTATVISAGDVELAQSLPAGGVDLIIGGHTHQSINESGLSAANIVNGIPIVQAGAMGRFVGQVDVTIGQEAAVTCARLIATADLPVDEEFETQRVRPLLERVRPIFCRELGRTANHPDLSTAAVQNNFAAGESALVNFITDAMVDRCCQAGYPVDIAAVDVSAVYAGLPVGETLTFGDWFTLMPYADTIRLGRLTGKQLMTLLESNACRADRPGDPHTERGFLHFSRRVRYTIELGERREAARSIDLLVDGVPLERQLEQVFLVALTSFAGESAAPWERQAAYTYCVPLTGLLPQMMETDLLLRDQMITYIRAHGGVTEEAGARRDGRLKIVRTGYA